MHYAAATNDVMSLADLADHGVSCSLQDTRGQSPLHYAVLHGTHAALQTLLEMAGVMVDAQNEGGSSPLWLAAQLGDVRSTELLLQAGANVNTSNIEEASPLHVASANGHVALVQLLLASGAFVNQTDASGDTPLHWAVREERADVARLLASAFGANLKAKNEVKKKKQKKKKKKYKSHFYNRTGRLLQSWRVLVACLRWKLQSRPLRISWRDPDFLLQKDASAAKTKKKKRKKREKKIE
jgi:ankyrin repeat protein